MNGRAGARAIRVRAVLAELGFTTPGVAGWRNRAGCSGADPEVFYPVGSGPVAREQEQEAKRICAGCPVRDLCLADVMASEDPGLRWGVVGGLSAAERVELFAQQRPGTAVA